MLYINLYFILIFNFLYNFIKKFCKSINTINSIIVLKEKIVINEFVEILFNFYKIINDIFNF